MCVSCGRTGPDYPLLQTHRYATLERLVSTVEYTTKPGKTSYTAKESYEFVQSVKRQIQKAIQAADSYLESLKKTDKSYEALVKKERSQSEELLGRLDLLGKQLALQNK